MELVNHLEARLLDAPNILVKLSELKDASLIANFFGAVVASGDLANQTDTLNQKTVYLCGDASEASNHAKELGTARRVFVVRQLSDNFEEVDWPVVDVGKVPILVHGVGVHFPEFFDREVEYFHQICAEHEFQSLTESNKPGTAHRTGIYLSPVKQEGEDLRFRLLRCSTNLSGPTDNFRATDKQIVDALNLEADQIFQDHARLNHVLAQVYHNTPATDTQKQKKAKIKSHADKTKDMPENGIMAFCTFYDEIDKLKPFGKFDHGYKTTSGLTTLCFRLKAPVAERPDCDLPEKFSVTLSPNSVFFMPLSTNRFYTHEIRSSVLDADKLPTRLGYVVRCSNTEAVHRDGHTYIMTDGEMTKLEEPTAQGMDHLRELYALENKTDEIIEYGNQFLFSMNTGDYKTPNYNMTDEFRVYSMGFEDNPFDQLLASVHFEDLGKGRQGALLLDPNESRGLPIVRTTAKFNSPPQCFGPLHQRLAEQIRARTSLPFALNNALIENYTNDYSKMGFHSDQALDLKEGSHIAVFSCYEDPTLANPPRMLVIESKNPDSEMFKVPLPHNSVVVFSLGTNRRFRHKITLDRSANPPNNRWLGITFRTSQTFVQLRENQPYFEDGTLLELSDEIQLSEFFALRSRENKEADFNYPRLTYTISESDRMPPKSQG